jgi:hypothetical protein
MDKDLVTLLQRLTAALEIIAEKASALGVTPEDDENPHTTIAEAISNVATQVKYLGNGSASTPMGAIEAHGAAIKDAAATIAEAINGLASSIDQLSESRS